MKLALFSAALVGAASAASQCVAGVSTAKLSKSSESTKASCEGAGKQWALSGEKSDELGAGQESAFAKTPRRKTWWTKRSSSSDLGQRIHFGGPPSDKELKLLWEQGFDAVYNVIDDKVPAAAKEAGLIYGASKVADPTADSEIAKLSAFLDYTLANTDGAVYVHCATGLWSGYLVQQYKANKKEHTKSSAAVKELANHGYNLFLVEGAVDKIEEATETDDAKEVYTEEPYHASFFAPGKYWQGKYLTKFGDTELYDAGQIYRSDLDIIKDSNVHSIVNMRKQREIDGTNTQEETTNLNVNTKGYTADLADDKILVKSRANTYVSPTSEKNYEVINEDEFGDAKGYNEEIEQAAVKAKGFNYYTLPIGGPYGGYNSESFIKYHDELIESINTAIDHKSHALFHCRTGYRTGAFPSLLIGLLQDKSAAEVLETLDGLGYSNSGNDDNLVKLISYADSEDLLSADVDPVTGKISEVSTTEQSSAAANAVSMAALLAVAAAMV